MLCARGLQRIYRLGGREIRALDGADLDLRDGEYLRIIGSSGSGKSTLLNLLAGLDRPTAGRIETPDGVLGEMSPPELAAYRARRVGMVFQSFNLISHRTALQNVELAMLFLGVPLRERLQRARDMLGRLGLAERLHHRPADLSGGEQQRVALARALVKRPRLLLADEPTGNLDLETGRQVLALLDTLVKKAGKTLIMATHSREVIGQADRIMTILNQSLVLSDERRS